MFEKAEVSNRVELVHILGLTDFFDEISWEEFLIKIKALNESKKVTSNNYKKYEKDFLS